MGGYGPATTSFSRALKRIGDRLEAELGDKVKIRYVWNILDFGYRAEDILWLVEHGILTLGYQSSSTQSMPAKEVVVLGSESEIRVRLGVWSLAGDGRPRIG